MKTKMKLLETEASEFQDVEQLCYLGLRLALGDSLSSRVLRGKARACTLRKFRAIESWASRQEPAAMRFEGMPNLEAAVRQNKGVIMCTPHVGPSFWIPLELMRRGFPFTLLIDTANFERLQVDYKFWRDRYTGDLEDPVRMINAEEPTAAWQMMRTLREGRILFVWLDGNAGLESAGDAQTTAAVNFCGLKIQVRKGPAFLSSYANAPILPAVARYSRGGRHVIRFEPILFKPAGESVDEYCQRAMQELFSLLETCVRRDPACWEEWYHLHRWREIYSDAESEAAVIKGYDPEVVLQLVLMLDGTKTEVLKMSHGDVLTNLHNGSGLLLSQELIALIRSLNGKRTVGQAIDRLAPRYGEALIMNNLLALCQNGFLTTLGQGNDLKRLAPGLAFAFTGS
jgi:lauroyl/myristoyl acyltransferase